MSAADFSAYIDREQGTVDRRIFSDQAIFDLEMERIFGRAWNFMCHESQIPKAGDYFLNYIGQESVITTRNKQGGIGTFLNTCRHRGNAVCRAEQGNARSFLCTYHGWTYDLEGKLIGVPGYKDFYKEKLDKTKWGLIPARVESYKGFVFANMDPDAPSLHEYLGEVGRSGISLIADQGDVMVVEGVQKNLVGCNWKVATENLFDWYHVPVSHASAGMSGFLNNPSGGGGNGFRDHRVMIGEFGHAIAGPIMSEERQTALLAMAAAQPEKPVPAMLDARWRQDPAARESLGPVGIELNSHPNVFPSMWIASFGTQVGLRLPRSLNETEMWWFSFVDKNHDKAQQDERIFNNIHAFGPAGMLEQDDGENWDQSTRATRGPIARRYPFNLQMGVGQGEIKTTPRGASYIDTVVNEHAQLWVHSAWAAWMDSDDWASLKAKTMAPTSGTV